MNRAVLARAVPRAVTVGLVLAATITPAAAQGPPQPGMPAGGPLPEEEKKEGVAEAAPRTPGLLPTTPVLPAPKSRRKRWKLFELDGYFRFRTDWFKNPHLGFKDDPAAGGAPYPRTVGCGDGTGICEENLSSANMRLKLMPTFNIDEGTSVFTEIDVLDNLVLGSTPEGLTLDGTMAEPPLGAFGEGQSPPVAGRNSDRDSITVRRVWAEVGLPLGILKFGRMPDHWGMGILANSGTEDTFNGGIDLDADYGDTVDRLSFSAIIPGTRLRGAIATDWSSTRLAANQTLAIRSHDGQPWDMSDHDDADQWLFTITQLDNPTTFRDAVSRGELVYNWGIRFAYRTQSHDYDTRGLTVGGDPSPANLIERGYKAYVPDVWFKAAYKQLQLELEAVGALGSIDHLDDYGITEPVDIRQFGGVGRFTFSGLDGKLQLGLELGAASGDQWDNAPAGRTHISNVQMIGTTALERSRIKEITRFVFDRDYKIDLILFRELLGAVSNAAYARPFLHYQLTPSLRLKVNNVTAAAVKPVATPGNSSLYGFEFDADLGYQGNGFSAGVAYGVLFPLGAMNHPDGAAFGFDTGTVDNTGDAGTAHTIQFRLALQF
jgi:uncharacterized protein (TIGR04551 family)